MRWRQNKSTMSCIVNEMACSTCSVPSAHHTHTSQAAGIQIEISGEKKTTKLSVFILGLVSVGDISSINITRRSDGMEWRNASSLA